MATRTSSKKSPKSQPSTSPSAVDLSALSPAQRKAMTTVLDALGVKVAPTSKPAGTGSRTRATAPAKPKAKKEPPAWLREKWEARKAMTEEEKLALSEEHKGWADLMRAVGLNPRHRPTWNAVKALITDGAEPEEAIEQVAAEVLDD